MVSAYQKTPLKEIFFSFSMTQSDLKKMASGSHLGLWLFEDLIMQKYMQNWIPHTRKPLKRRFVQNSVCLF